MDNSIAFIAYVASIALQLKRVGPVGSESKHHQNRAEERHVLPEIDVVGHVHHRIGHLPVGVHLGSNAEKEEGDRTKSDVWPKTSDHRQTSNKEKNARNNNRNCRSQDML